VSRKESSKSLAPNSSRQLPPNSLPTLSFRLARHTSCHYQNRYVTQYRGVESFSDGLLSQDIEAFRPLLTVLRTFIHGKHIAEPFRTVVEKNLLKTRPDVLVNAKCNTMDEYILRAQSYGLVAQVGHGKASRLRLLENSGLAFT
jgi:hypothetical protein